MHVVRIVRDHWASAVLAAGLCLLPGLARGQLDLTDLNPFGEEAAQPAEGEAAASEAAPQRDIEDVIQEALQLKEEGKFAEAVELFTQILNQAPQRADVALERGRCLVELKEDALALESFTAAVTYGVRFPQIYTEALNERGKVSLRLGNAQEAVDDFSMAVQAQPANPEFLYQRGRAFVRLGQVPSFGMPQGTADFFTQAIASLKRAIEVDPQFALAYAERGNAYSALGESDKAVADLMKAVELAPEDSRLQAQLGFALLRRGDTERRKNAPDFTQIEEDYRLAIQTFDDYLELEGGKAPEEFEDVDPEFIKPDQVFLGRAIAHVALAAEIGEEDQRQVHFEQAVQDSEQALEYDKNAVTAVFQKGVAQRLMGNLDAAADSFSEALEMSPVFAEARLRRGIVYYYMGEHALARGDFHGVVQQLETPDGRAEFWIGATHAAEGNFQEAVRHYSKSIRLNPGFRPAFNNRGLAYLQLGQYQRAMDDFDELLRRNRNDEVARERRDMARQLSQK